VVLLRGTVAGGHATDLKRVLIVATTTGYQIRSFGEAAEKLGVRLVFANDRCDQLEDPWWDQAIPIRFFDELGSIQAISEALGANPPGGVIAVGDRPVTLAARVNAAFGLPGNPLGAAVATRNKLESRRAFQAGGLPVPAFRVLPPSVDPWEVSLTFHYPVVLKPLAMSGSRGVIRSDTSCEFVQAFDRIRALMAQPDVRVERDASHDMLLVESFIPGREFAVEGLLTEGSLRVTAVFDKPDPLDGPYFEETIYVTPSRESAAIQEQIVAAVAAGTAALGLRHGPVHAECRVNESGVHLLEIAARPIGGLCSKTLRFVSPGGEASLEEVLLRHALRQDVGAFVRERAASGVMMIPIPHRGVYKGVQGERDARAVPDIVDVQITVKPDATIVPLPEGKSYLGFIFARATTPLAVEQALRAAHAKLRFRIDRDLPLVGDA
jgi:ATP-grasp domain/L-amino acid ligase C-terminal domain 2